jgi:hypothetical protein
MFHFEGYIMTDSSSQSNREENTWKIPVLEDEDRWKIPVIPHSHDIGPDNKCMDIKLSRQI